MAGVVRINGLVGFVGRLRSAMARGMNEEEKLKWKKGAGMAVGQVDAILKARGARVADLAGPSRKAYGFLMGVDWEGMETREGSGEADSLGEMGMDEAQNENGAAENEGNGSEGAGTGAETSGRLRWTGLGPYAERLMGRLAAGPSDIEVEEVRLAIERMSARMEGTIRRENVPPGGLTAVTREWRGWLAWMGEKENIAAYVAAVGRGRGAMRGDGVGSGAAEMLIEFRPIKHIYRKQVHAGRVRLMLPTPMVCFDAGGFADLAELVRGRERLAKQKVVLRMAEGAYADLREEIEALGGIVDGTRGAFHDLAESFARVNAKYFAGAMARPKLTWSRSFTRRKFGHYDHVRDWVMLSSTMDQAGVPALVVDYIMYHELLHKKHGIKWSNGRGYAHTAAFYADEKKFEGWERGEGWIKRLASEGGRMKDEG